MEKTGNNKRKLFFQRILPGLALIIIGIFFFIKVLPDKSDNSSIDSRRNNVDHTELPVKSNIVHANNNNFDSIISDGISLVDFWAEWCPPCRLQTPILEEISFHLPDNASIVKVNVDHNSHLAARYRIRTIPTIILFKDGEPLEGLVGLQQKESLTKLLNKHLN